jgi:hypothetical protein
MESVSSRHIPMFTRIPARQNSTNSVHVSVKLYAALVIPHDTNEILTHTYLRS